MIRPETGLPRWLFPFMWETTQARNPTPVVGLRPTWWVTRRLDDESGIDFAVLRR